MERSPIIQEQLQRTARKAMPKFEDTSNTINVQTPTCNSYLTEQRTSQIQQNRKKSLLR